MGREKVDGHRQARIHPGLLRGWRMMISAHGEG